MGIGVPSYCPRYSPYLLYIRNAASFEEDDEDGSLKQERVANEHGEAVNSGDRMGHADPVKPPRLSFRSAVKSTIKASIVQQLPDFRKVHVRGPG
jgi:hypothetical protein